jgi:protein-export membrane protein SecD
MTQKQKHIVILLVVAALVAVSVFLIVPPGKKTHLGLDLQGGLEVVFDARTPSGGTPSSAQLTQTINIMQKRVNGMGTTEAQVQQQGADQIAVSLPGETDKAHALATIGQTAQLEFFVDYKQRVAGPVAQAEVAANATAAQTDAAINAAVAELVKKARTGTSQIGGSTVSVPPSQYKELGQLTATNRTTAHFELVSAPPNTYGNTATDWYIYELPAAMNGSAIAKASQGWTNNKPDAQIDFTGQGGKDFAKITLDLSNHGLVTRQNQSFAIVLDGVMQSDPVVNYVDNPQGISGGSAIIEGGNMTVADAKDLALVLNYGALPVKLNPAESQYVSATLGKDSLNQALVAGLVGFFVVLIYMLVYYRFLGLVADFALLIYGVLLWGVFNAIPVTLTLPGIAGMILTIGVAADANVVIFERIREEVRRGRTVRSAISAGYSRGFKTILDANVLTLLTALVLFEFATAQPRGFAVTLIIGVLVSMFTAVLATRAMLGLLSDLPFFGRASFMGVRASEVALATETQVDLAPAATRPSASPSASKSGGGRSTASRKKKKRR